jgi:cell division protein FtsW
VGLGSSRAKWGFLPYAHTDFIFAVLAEELGLLGTIGVVALFATVSVAGFLAALRAPDRFGMLLAFGVTTWILAQAVLNMGAVLALVPVLGVTLPFLSFGGSSLVVTMAAVGLLLNVARQSR